MSRAGTAFVVIAPSILFVEPGVRGPGAGLALLGRAG